MLPKVKRTIAIAVLALATAGCGTALSKFSDDKRDPDNVIVNHGIGHIYLGVQSDLDLVWCSWTFGMLAGPIGILLAPLMVAVAVVDLPLSFVADTLFLPWDLTVEAKSPRPRMGQCYAE